MLPLVGALAFGATSAAAQSPYGLIYQSAGASVGGQFSYDLGVDCPANTTSVGGGYDDDGTAVTSSSPSGGGWEVSGQGTLNVGTAHPRATTSCAPPNVTPPLTFQVEDLTLKADLNPTGGQKGSVVAECGSGSTAIAGGYELGDGQTLAVGLAASQPSSSGDGLSRGWEVAGANTSLISDQTLTSYANCLNSAVANGIFRLYWDGAGDEIEDDSVTATCVGGGGPVSGGARSTKNPDGGGYHYTGSFDSLTFNSARTGFTVDYNSGRPGKDWVQALVLCGWVQRFVTKLTQEDFATACRESYKGDVVGAKPGKLATDWQCVNADGSTFPLASPQGLYACEYQRTTDPTATYLDIDDPMSWVCYDDYFSSSSQRSAGVLAGRATDHGGGSVRVAGRLKLKRPIELDRARVWLSSILHEPSRRGELFPAGRRGGSLPVRLRTRNRPGAAVFTGGSKPRVKLRLRQKNEGRLLRFRVTARRGHLAEPRHCAYGSRRTTRLGTHFKLQPRDGEPVEVEARAFWRCRGGSLVKVKPPLPLR